MTPAADTIGLTEVAQELGAHYDTVRKMWRAWAGLTEGRQGFIGFPLPFRYPAPGQRGVVKWRRAAFADWKLARERALGEGRARVPSEFSDPGAAHQAANLNAPRLVRQRAEMNRLMERN